MSILLSEIIECCDKEEGLFFEEIKKTNYCYGVKVDVESFTPPKEIKNISFVAVFKDNELEESLIDTLISYSLSGVNIILEVNESQSKFMDYVFSVSNNVGFDVSLIPSNELILGRSNDWDSYIDFVVKSSGLFLNKDTNVSLLPLTGYIEYLFCEYYSKDDLKAIVPTEPYILNKFFNVIPEKVSNEFKEKLRELVYIKFNGKEEFEDMADSIFVAMKEKLISNMKDLSKTPFESDKKPV